MTTYYAQVELPVSFAGKVDKTVSLTVQGESAVNGKIVAVMEMTDPATSGTKQVVVDSFQAHVVV